MSFPLSKSSAALPAAVRQRTLSMGRQVNRRATVTVLCPQKRSAFTRTDGGSTHVGRLLLSQLLPVEQWDESPEQSGYILTEEQKAVIKLVVWDEKNVFFTGSTGTGKSLLLRKLLAALATRDRQKPTHLSGRTLCTLARTYRMNPETLVDDLAERQALMDIQVEEMVKRIRASPDAMLGWEQVDVLVIDQVQRIHAGLFNWLDRVGRRIRGNDEPFGGIQVVATGDFSQLPPVAKGCKPSFCFEAAAWTSFHHQVTLTKVFRKNDADFGRMLADIREGHLSQRDADVLRMLRRPVRLWRGLEPTELSPQLAQAIRANVARLVELSGPAHVYSARDDGEADPEMRSMIMSEYCASETLTLKKGGQVMLTKNLDDGRLVNGTLGEVVGFSSGGLDTPPIPEVRFALPDGNTLLRQCPHETWTVEALALAERKKGKFKRVVLARRTQIPLMHAWALTTHTAQSQTLQMVKVDLDHMFKPGQVYTALSRVASVDGLQITNFDRDKIAAHEKVKDFYKTLRSNALPKNAPTPNPFTTASTRPHSSPLSSLALDILSPRPSPAAQSPAARRYSSDSAAAAPPTRE